LVLYGIICDFYGIICENTSQTDRNSSLEVLNEVDESQYENKTLNDAEDFQESSQATHESDSQSTTKTITNGSKESSDVFAFLFKDDDDSLERLNCVIHQLQLVIKESKVDCRHIDKVV